MLNDIVNWYLSLHTCFQILAGVVVLTWLPAGIASSSYLFAYEVKHDPAGTLLHYRAKALGFWILAAGGYFTFLFVGYVFSSPYAQYSGMCVPCKAAKREARRLISEWQESPHASST